jgi:hypothetical protein
VESRLNAPLFVGFPGFVSELWLAADGRGVYRGTSGTARRWPAPMPAPLWRVLALVSVPGSIHHRVIPGLHRDHVLADPAILNGVCPDRPRRWWRVIGTN